MSSEMNRKDYKPCYDQHEHLLTLVSLLLPEAFLRPPSLTASERLLWVYLNCKFSSSLKIICIKHEVVLKPCRNFKLIYSFWIIQLHVKMW